MLQPREQDHINSRCNPHGGFDARPFRHDLSAGDGASQSRLAGSNIYFEATKKKVSSFTMLKVKKTLHFVSILVVPVDTSGSVSKHQICFRKPLSLQQGSESLPTQSWFPPSSPFLPPASPTSSGLSITAWASSCALLLLARKTKLCSWLEDETLLRGIWHINSVG